VAALRTAWRRDRKEAQQAQLVVLDHTTSRSAAELLLFLHAGMMAAKGSVHSSTVKAGRSA